MHRIGKMLAATSFVAVAAVGTPAPAQEKSSGPTITCDQVIALKKKNTSLQTILATYGEWCTQAAQRRRIVEGYAVEFYAGGRLE